MRAPSRRAVAALLALTLTVLVTGAGVLGDAVPASAGVPPNTCTWTEEPGPDGPAVHLDASTVGWMTLFVDGVRNDDYSWSLSSGLWPADAAFAAQLGAQTLDYRWYDPNLYPADDVDALHSITHDSPYVCEYTWTDPNRIDFAQPADVTYGDSLAPLEVTALSGLPVSTESLTQDVCTVDGAAVTLVGIGACTIKATQPGGVAGGTTYAAAIPVTRTFDVAPVALHQEITFTQPANMRLGEGAQVLDASADSEGPVGFESLTRDVCTVQERASNATVLADALGDCTVHAHQAGGYTNDGLHEYNEATADKTFHVWPAALDQTIAFPELDAARLGDADRHLVATATSGLAVTYDTQTPETCSVTGTRRDQVSYLAVGTCTIEATQAGNASAQQATVYDAAEPVTRSFEIAAAPVTDTPLPPTTPPTPKAQQISVSGAHGYALSKRSARVRFASSARLPVTVRSMTPKVCTSTSGAVRLKSAGACILTASAAGNHTYAAATVRAAFRVWAAPTAPVRARAPRAVEVLGKGEAGYRVVATPSQVCRVATGRVVLVGAGRCTIVVKDGSRVVRRGKVTATEIRASKPGRNGPERVRAVRFGFNSAALTTSAKRTLRQLAPKLRKSDLVVVYGNTQAHGGGDNAANRKLSQRRAEAVVRFLRKLGVKAKATAVAMSSRNPLGKNEAANRRADIYWIR